MKQRIMTLRLLIYNHKHVIERTLNSHGHET